MSAFLENKHINDSGGLAFGSPWAENTPFKKQRTVLVKFYLTATKTVHANAELQFTKYVPILNQHLVCSHTLLAHVGC